MAEPEPPQCLADRRVVDCTVKESGRGPLASLKGVNRFLVEIARGRFLSLLNPHCGLYKPNRVSDTDLSGTGEVSTVRAPDQLLARYRVRPQNTG
jgi:hypothetical protein